MSSSCVTSVAFLDTCHPGHGLCALINARHVANINRKCRYHPPAATCMLGHAIVAAQPCDKTFLDNHSAASRGQTCLPVVSCIRHELQDKSTDVTAHEPDRVPVIDNRRTMRCPNAAKEPRCWDERVGPKNDDEVEPKFILAFMTDDEPSNLSVPHVAHVLVPVNRSLPVISKERMLVFFREPKNPRVPYRDRCSLKRGSDAADIVVRRRTHIGCAMVVVHARCAWHFPSGHRGGHRHVKKEGRFKA